MLSGSSTEDGIQQDELERRLRLAFNSPGISPSGVFNFASLPLFPGIFDVHAYGAVGDGVTDDRTAIQNAAAAAGPGGVVVFRPDTTYRIASSIILAYDEQTWLMHGATIGVDFVGAGIVLGTDIVRIQRTRLFGGTVQPLAAALDWTAGGVGYKLLNCSNCVLEDVFVRWLEKGIAITSPDPPHASETTQNWIVRPVLASCALPIWLHAAEGGTVNENQFIGGQVSYAGSDPSATGRYAVTISHHASSFGNVNGIKFYGTYFGNSKGSNRPSCFYVDAVGCLFSGCHSENFPDPRVTFAGDALLGLLPNVFWGGAADWLTPEADLASGTTGIAAPWIYSGANAAGVAGGAQAGSTYVWLVKQLGANSKTALAVKSALDVVQFGVRGDGLVTSGSNTVEGGHRINGPAASARPIFWQTAGLSRWDARATQTAEGGANAGSDFNLNAYDDAGALIGTALAIARANRAATFTFSVKSTSDVAGIGYDTGAGGTVAQGSGSGKATGVTLNKVTGLITLDGATLNAGTIVSFTLTNSAITATDTLILQHNSGGTVGAYTFSAQPGAGSAVINVRNATAGNLTESPVIRFTVIKSVSA